MRFEKGLAAHVPDDLTQHRAEPEFHGAERLWPHRFGERCVVALLRAEAIVGFATARPMPKCKSRRAAAEPQACTPTIFENATASLPPRLARRSMGESL